MNKDIKKYINEYNPWHDDTQIEYFIVGNNHTDYGRYKQAIAEISSHYDNMQNLYIEQKTKNAEIWILKAEIDSLNKKWWKINKAKIKLKKVEIEKNKLWFVQIKRWIKRAKNELWKNLLLAKRYEELIKWKDRKELEIEYHKERLSKLLALNTVWWWSNLSWVMDVITSLPDNIQNPLLLQLQQLNSINYKLIWK